MAAKSPKNNQQQFRPWKPTYFLFWTTNQTCVIKFRFMWRGFQANAHWGFFLQLHLGFIFWGNEHYDISMHFHTRFSIRNIHKYVCVIYSFMSDVSVFFHETMSVVHGVCTPGLLSRGLPVFWRLFLGGNGLRTTTVDYVSCGLKSTRKYIFILDIRR